MRSVEMRFTLRSWAWPATPSLTLPDSATPAELRTSKTSTRNCQELNSCLRKPIICMICDFYDISVLFIQTSQLIIFFRHASNKTEVHQGLELEAAWASFSASFVSWACWKDSKAFTASPLLKTSS